MVYFLIKISFKKTTAKIVSLDSCLRSLAVDPVSVLTSFVGVVTVLDCVCLQFSSQQGNRGRYTPNYSPAPMQMRPPSMDTSGSQIPSDGILKEIAEKVHRRDWDLLANSLGFLAEDVDNYRLENPTSGSQQVGCYGSVLLYMMWRES